MNELPDKKRLPKRITEKYLYNCSIAYLQRYVASQAQLYRVMERRIERACRAHPDLVKEECLVFLSNVVRRLKEEGWLNETVALNGLVQALRRRGASRQAIHYKLVQKGFGREQITETLQQYDGAKEGDLLAAIFLMRRRKLGCFGKTSDWKERQKAFGIMMRGGFSFDTAQTVLRMTQQEVDDLLA